MLKKIHAGMKLAPQQGRSWLCLLVAITFLYNPFLATSSCLNGQRVSHLPSFRATVASLELLKFKPEEKSEPAAVPDCDVQAPTVLSPLSVETEFGPFEVSEPVRAEFLPTGNLFFRPPPAV